MGNKRKSYYNNQKSNKKSKLMFGNTIKLGPDMKGFLITYNCKFTFIINEAKKLLQQFSSPTDTSNESKNTSKSNDLEKLLQEELDSLNSRDKEFNILDTGAKYTIFVNLNSVNPNQVTESIFQHIETTQKPLGRYVQRLLPVLNTCKSYLDDIEKCIKVTLDELDAIKQNDTKPFKYCCVFKTSNNGTLSRDEIFKRVGVYMQSKNKLNKVDFDEPDYVLLIHVICNVCFISFVKDYFKFRKYNLIEMGVKFNTNLNQQNEFKPFKTTQTETETKSDFQKNNDKNDNENLSDNNLSLTTQT